VQYYEPAKYVARLRALKPTGALVFHINMEAGHSGKSAASRRSRDGAAVRVLSRLLGK